MSEEVDFSKWLVGEVKKMIKLPKSKKEQKIMADRMHANLFGVDYKDDHGSLGKMSTSNLFIRDIWKPYAEIDESNSRIKMTALFIKQYPYLPSWKKEGITKTRYLRYHYENYLNEIYLMEQRMKRIFDVTVKHCKKLEWEAEILLVKKMRKWYYKQLGNSLDIRGAHVHEERFVNQKIDQLESLEFITAMEDPIDTFEEYGNLVRFFKEHEYRIFRRKLHKEILNGAEALSKLHEVALNVLAEKVLIKLNNHYIKNEKK